MCFVWLVIKEACLTQGQSSKKTDTARLLHVLNRGGICLPYFPTLLYIYTDLADVPLFVGIKVGYAKNRQMFLCLLGLKWAMPRTAADFLSSSIGLYCGDCCVKYQENVYRSKDSNIMLVPVFDLVQEVSRVISSGLLTI